MTVDEYREYSAAYDLHAAGVPGDVEFYRDLALGASRAGGLTVELGVGTGRVAVPAAEAGARVVGLDLSREMLAIARRKAGERGVLDRLQLVQADMRRFALRRPAALVTIPFRAFLHNLTTEDQLATLRCCFDALEPGGRLALNVFNPSIPYITKWLARGPEEFEEHPEQHRAEHSAYQPTAQIVRSRLRVRDAQGRVRRPELTLRYVWRYEMEHLLARTGFEVEALYGDFAGARFGETATEQVWIARRP